MSDKIRIKNISRGTFFLNLGFVKEGKVVNLPIGAVYDLTRDEYDYLDTQCRGAFDKGFIKVVDAPSTIEIETFNEANQKSDVDISNMLDLTLVKFRSAIKDITSVNLLKDIRDAAVQANKSEKFIAEIDKQLKETANGSILL